MIKSPCIRRCIYDYEKDRCTGCFRTQGEIEAWWKMTDEEKREAFKKIEQRRRESGRMRGLS